MSSYYATCAAVLLLLVMAGLKRAAQGPSRADRMQAAQLFGTGGIAILVLLWLQTGLEAMLDVALVLSLLSAVTIIAFTYHLSATRHTDRGEDE